MTIKYVDIEYLRVQDSNAGQLLLAGSGNTVTYTQFVTVDNSGNVGIGTSNPTYKLSVLGNVNIQGHLTGDSISTAFGQPGTVQFADGNGTLNGNQTHLFWDSTNFRLGIGTSIPVSTLQVNYTAYESTSTSWSTTSPTVLDSFPCTQVRSAHYFVQVTDEDNSCYHTSQITVVQDGIQAYKSEYNVVTSADKLGTFDCIVSSGNLQLTFTAYYATNKTVKITRTSMTA